MHVVCIVRAIQLKKNIKLNLFALYHNLKSFILENFSIVVEVVVEVVVVEDMIMVEVEIVVVAVVVEVVLPVYPSWFVQQRKKNPGCIDHSFVSKPRCA